jgi:homogentisate phytyltransferase / homogentisate geranylgeranyltransferase
MSQISPEKPPVLPAKRSHSQTNRFGAWLHAFWKFSRPHTIIGTSLSVLALSLIAWANGREPASPLEFSDLIHFGTALVIPALLACLCGNVYIVGLNQIEDVEIDRINKPHLPLASGEFSRRQGWQIVLVMGVLALGISAWQGPFLMATVWSSLLIGTAYSLPPIRLKRSPLWASLCIFSVRGAIVNLGLFLHFHQRLSNSIDVPASVVALTLFILVFTFAIAIFKDIPDLEGDRRYHITTFTVKLGQETVFHLSLWVLTACYVGLIGAGYFLPGVNAGFLGLSHALSLALLWHLSRRVDLQDKSAIAQFYQFIWKLFYLEYLLFPIACVLG